MVSVFGAFVIYLAGEGYECFDTGIAFSLYIGVEGYFVFHRFLAGTGDNHSLSFSPQFVHHGVSKVFQDNLDTLLYVGIVEHSEAMDLSLSFTGFQFRIFFNGLVQLIEGLIGGIAGQYIKDKAFFDGLFHGVEVEGLTLAMFIHTAKEMQRGGLSKKIHQNLW